MKRTKKFSWLLALAITAGSHVVTAQTVKDVFNDSETPIFYLGIDFTKAKLIDDAGANAFDIRDRQY
ncbi:MAG TPA: hypothetical protein VEZ17_08720, partial [Chitinophagaceae bacterium]|nr:hypothetical protein [Chitinophagaceae bacterium]